MFHPSPNFIVLTANVAEGSLLRKGNVCYFNASTLPHQLHRYIVAPWPGKVKST